MGVEGMLADTPKPSASRTHRTLRAMGIFLPTDGSHMDETDESSVKILELADVRESSAGILRCPPPLSIIFYPAYQKAILLIQYLRSVRALAGLLQPKEPFRLCVAQSRPL